MLYGIPLLDNRVAPRCTIADSLLLISVARNKVRFQSTKTIQQHSWEELIRMLVQARVDTLVCGGISQIAKEWVKSNQVDVMENVVGTVDDVIWALQTGNLCPGFGLQEMPAICTKNRIISTENSALNANKTFKPQHDAANEHGAPEYVDCLSCRDRVCLRGQSCDLQTAPSKSHTQKADREMLESAVDIACEEDRTLCRLSELIYFCLGMRYRRLGIAFCIDLLEPTEILTGVLRRFFEVYPVCCKVGGIRINDPIMNLRNEPNTSEHEHVICNPLGQAELLNQIETDINIIVGLCMGVDCVFTRASIAPVTTLFVKDHSLANNPIGALYSEYYLKEATLSSAVVT